MKLKLLFLMGCLFALASCTKRNMVYFSDLPEQGEYKEAITNFPEPKIQSDDLLSIKITSLSPEANALFNAGEVPVGIGVGGGAGTLSSEGFLVDKDGYIDYPVLGRVKLGGLTKSEAIAKLKTDLQRYLKDPFVRIRFLNYKITVIGEVNSPATFTVPSEKINIIEAIGLAGDLNFFGRRENILILREEEGVRKINRINLNSKDVFSSPYFYLKQNDIIYVEPNKAKIAQTSTTRANVSFAMSIFSFVLLLLIRTRNL